jgi:hypothetical protein
VCSSDLYFFTYNGTQYNQPTIAQAEALIDSLLSSGYPWQKSFHLIENRDLTATQIETGKSLASQKFSLGDASKFMGGSVSYRIRYIDGFGGCSVGVDFNGVNLAQHENIAVGSDISGSFDITTFATATHNYVTVGQSHLPGLFWCTVAYDVTVTLGYSSQPSPEPSIEFGLPSLEWWQWGLIGVVGLGAIYMVGGKKGRTTLNLGEPTRRVYSAVKKRVKKG